MGDAVLVGEDEAVVPVVDAGDGGVVGADPGVHFWAKYAVFALNAEDDAQDHGSEATVGDDGDAVVGVAVSLP